MTRESAFVRAPSVARAERGGEHENTARRSRRIDGARRRARVPVRAFERSIHGRRRNGCDDDDDDDDARARERVSRRRVRETVEREDDRRVDARRAFAIGRSSRGERRRRRRGRGERQRRDRNEAYADATREKMTRGALRSACDRALHARGPCVILDSLNAIKGFRYELWCCARAQATRYCVVHVDASDDDVEAWNGARREGGNEDAYDDAILRDLCFRFERPIASNRWDSPLFTFRPATDSEARRGFTRRRVRARARRPIEDDAERSSVGAE